MQISQGKKAILFIIFILILDQFIKIWIKTHMVLGQEIHFLGKYGMLHFIENNGMAFGMEWGGKPGKLILSIFRLIAIFAISWYLCQIIRKKASLGLTLAISAILAGAIGNIIDSAFYGMIFNESTYSTTAVLFPDSGGYSSFLHGKVVDMFYFPVINLRECKETVIYAYFNFANYLKIIIQINEKIINFSYGTFLSIFNRKDAQVQDVFLNPLKYVYKFSTWYRYQVRVIHPGSHFTVCSMLPLKTNQLKI